MKAYVLHGVGDYRYEEVSMPKAEAGNVLVKVKAVGICGSDIPRIYQTGAYSHPLIPGHEFAGEVVEVGEGVSSSWVGRRVGVFPLIPCMELLSKLLHALYMHEGALTVIPVKDTVYYGRDGRIESLLDRDRLMAGQAPEAFRLGAYYRANKRLLPDKILKINGSTEPAILAGMDIGCVAGEERNFKITTREDLERLEQIVRNK